MNTKIAEGVVRHVVSSLNNNNNISKKIKQSKVCFSPNSIQKDGDYIGWWIMTDQPVTAGDILFEEVKGVVMAHLNPVGRIASGLGGVAARASNIHSQANNINKIKNMATGKLSQGITNRFSRAWAAGAYSSAKETKQEFSILLGQGILIGGAVKISQTNNSDALTVSIQTYNKSDLVSFMGHGERQGGIKYCAEIAEGGTVVTI